MNVLHYTENGNVFPEFFRVTDIGNGKVEIAVSEQGLHSPVAKIVMPAFAAQSMFFATWSAFIPEED